MADPTRVLELIAQARAFLETYGQVILEGIYRALAFLGDLMSQLPGWTSQVGAFLASLIAIVRGFLNL